MYSGAHPPFSASPCAPSKTASSGHLAIPRHHPAVRPIARRLTTWCRDCDSAQSSAAHPSPRTRTASDDGRPHRAIWGHRCRNCSESTGTIRRCPAPPRGCPVAPGRSRRCGSSRRCCANWWRRFSPPNPTRTSRSRSAAADPADRIRQSCTCDPTSKCSGCFRRVRCAAWWTRSPAASPATRRPCSGGGKCCAHPASRLPALASACAPSWKSTNERRRAHRDTLRAAHLTKNKVKSGGLAGATSFSTNGYRVRRAHCLAVVGEWLMGAICVRYGFYWLALTQSR